MSYPSLEQYNEAFQAPQVALRDPELKSGAISKTGLGLPLALCGGFALTYTINTAGKKYAVRCFHKQSNLLEKRYDEISNRLKILSSKYFLNFEYQPKGVYVGGKEFPIVKMAWATGDTLGEFLEKNFRNKIALQNLHSSLLALSSFLENQSIAHGDIQPGNVMVSGGGNNVQLIDYDGMFVEELRNVGSNELGHRNFQHPKRSNSSWDAKLDRFSFISLSLALRALESHPELWDKTHSDGDSILFKANDFVEPAQSLTFRELFGRPQFADDAKNFAAICKSSYDKIPSLEDFLARRNIPQVVITVSTSAPEQPSKYLSNYPVLDAQDYSDCFRHVGDRVELIGKIVEVKIDRTRHGKPYIFINFGNWQGNIVKITIWSEGLETISKKPDSGWVGKWISVTGLMEPPYRSKRYKYSHLSVTITQSNQMHLITDAEAKFRLAGSSTRSIGSNKEVLGAIQGKSPAISATSQPRQAATRNQAVLEKIQDTQKPQTTSTQRPKSTSSYTPPYSGGYKTSPKSQPTNSNCFIASAVYGIDAEETDILRAWRDSVLMPNIIGRLLVEIYYIISPVIAKVICNAKIPKIVIKSILDKFIKFIRF